MYILDQDLQLKPEAPWHFKGTISENWLINNVANGGYIMALMASAMLQASDKKCASIMTASYMYPCLSGNMELSLEEISRSSQLTRLQASLYQENQEKVRAWGSFSSPTQNTTQEQQERYETGPPQVASLEECTTVPAIPKHSLMDNLEIRLDPSSAGWINGELAERSIQKGWISFRDGRPYDNPAVFLVADSFPPAVFVSHGLVTWVPTIELTVNIRHIPQTRWLKFCLQSRFFTGGMIEEDGEVWDEEGTLVCISRQIARVRI